jgi:hypothetical protein
VVGNAVPVVVPVVVVVVEPVVRVCANAASKPLCEVRNGAAARMAEAMREDFRIIIASAEAPLPIL